MPKQSATSQTETLSARGLRTRQHILDAARSVLVEHGHLDISMVSTEANVSPGLPFRYFESKGVLLEALIEDFHNRLSEAAVFHHFQGDTWQEREKLRVSAWVKFLLADKLSPIVLVGMGGDPIATAALENRHKLAVEFGARNMARAQADGDINITADPHLLAAGVLGGVHSMVVAALVRDGNPPVTKLTNEVWEFVARSTGATT